MCAVSWAETRRPVLPVRSGESRTAISVYPSNIRHMCPTGNGEERSSDIKHRSSHTLKQGTGVAANQMGWVAQGANDRLWRLGRYLVFFPAS